jgi:hypothetical protein
VVFASNGRAYSGGTGAVISIDRAPVNTPEGRSSLKTIVCSSGVSMPEISGTPLVAPSGAPTRSPK